MSINVKVSNQWHGVSTVYVKYNGAWKTAGDVWMNVGGTWKSQLYVTGNTHFIPNSGARNNTTSAATTYPFSWTVPNGVHTINVAGVGGGGYSGAYHDGGYGEHAKVGSPGGGAAVTIPVKPGDIISGSTGGGGGSGYYNGTDNWGYGGAGAATTVFYNGTLIFTANAGGGPGASPGSATFNVGTYGGTVSTGTTPTTLFNGSDSGPVGSYNPWDYVDYSLPGSLTVPNIGSPAIAASSYTDMSSYTRLGLGQYPGWVHINW